MIDDAVIAFPVRRTVCETCAYRPVNWCVLHDREVPDDFVCPDWKQRGWRGALWGSSSNDEGD